jgi:hypothetical protein
MGGPRTRPLGAGMATAVRRQVEGDDRDGRVAQEAGALWSCPRGHWRRSQGRPLPLPKSKKP